MGSVGSREAVVILTNGAAGMQIVPRLVEEVLPGSHPAFDWLGYDRYDRR
jgi:hypothetical protein